MSRAEDISRTLCHGFERALLQRPELEVSSDLSVAGRMIRLRIVGKDLAARIIPPLAHLRVPPGDREPDLSIGLWDEAATGVARPIGDLRGTFASNAPYGDGVLASARDGRLLGFQTMRASTIIDLDAGIASGWVRSAEGLTLYEAAKPLQPILFPWYADADLMPIHAGLVAYGGKGILMGGAGGSGKSTTALLCGKAGFDYLGDDYVAVPRPTAEGAIGHSLYISAWLHPSHGERLPWLQPHRFTDTLKVEAKVAFSLVDALDGRLARTSGIHAVALPRVTGAERTSYRRASPVETLLRLSPSAVLQLPFVSSAQTMGRLSALVRSLPCYWLDLGRDFDDIPRQMKELLQELPA